jgi:hypothetical protein
MANRIVSWSGDDHIVSPNFSEASSVMSFDSILSDKPEASLGDGDRSASRMAAIAESQPVHTASQVIEPNGTRASTLTTTYPETDAADQNGSFVRHNKYFFKDGNVSFLV